MSNTNITAAAAATGFAVPSLRDKAIVVKLSRRLFNPNKQDKAATNAAIVAMGGTSTRVGKFNKRLLSKCAELKQTQQAFQAIYDYVRDHSLPWKDEGYRLLPNANYREFVEGYRDLKEECERCVNKLASVWDQACTADKAVLNGMWDPNDYPSVGEMVSQWGVSITFQPISSSADFRIDMDDEDKQALDEALARVEAGATDYLMQELLTPVKALIERLSIPKGEKGSRFCDTIITNVTDITERARKLNINNDERIDGLIEAMDKAVAGLSPEAIRQSDALRATAVKRMKEVEAKAAEWF